MIIEDINTVRYFFSAMMQSMAALFAVGAVFAVFQLQLINQQLNQNYKAFKQFVIAQSPSKKEEVTQWLDKDILHHLLFYNDIHKLTYFKMLSRTYEHIGTLLCLVLNQMPRREFLEEIYINGGRIDFGLSAAFADYYIQINRRLELSQHLRDKLKEQVRSLSAIFFLSGLCLAICEWICPQPFLLVLLFLCWLAILLERVLKLIAHSVDIPKEDWFNNPFTNCHSRDVEISRIQKIVEIQFDMEERVRKENKKIKRHFEDCFNE